MTLTVNTFEVTQSDTISFHVIHYCIFRYTLHLLTLPCAAPCCVVVAPTPQLPPPVSRECWSCNIPRGSVHWRPRERKAPHNSRAGTQYCNLLKLALQMASVVTGLPLHMAANVAQYNVMRVGGPCKSSCTIPTCCVSRWQTKMKKTPMSSSIPTCSIS